MKKEITVKAAIEIDDDSFYFQSDIASISFEIEVYEEDGVVVVGLPEDWKFDHYDLEIQLDDTWIWLDQEEFFQKIHAAAYEVADWVFNHSPDEWEWDKDNEVFILTDE